MTQSERSDRREFLRSAGRYALAAMLGGGMSLLLARGGANCLRPAGCDNCGVLTRCPLPQAAQARERQEGRGDV